MERILFLIHDLGQGGAEKVLVNLVNNMDATKFDISVTALFGGGVNEQFLKPHTHFPAVFPKNFRGNIHVMKLLTPRQLHKLCVKEHYDIEVSYLEGPAARVVSGCTDSDTKLLCWIHAQQQNKQPFLPFRSEAEAQTCYRQFDEIICVANAIREDFMGIYHCGKECKILYNTVESDVILRQSIEPAIELKEDGKLRLAAVGTLKSFKGYERLLRIMRKLENAHLYILGRGPLEQQLKAYVRDNHLADRVTFLGYQTNPYTYVAKCGLFVCASFAEGFSTAATEALIVGTPVCTTEVSGMREMLGDNEYCIITDNDEEALYEGIKDLLDHPEKLAHYKEKAAERGKWFSTEETVREVEEMLLKLAGE